MLIKNDVKNIGSGSVLMKRPKFGLSLTTALIAIIFSVYNFTPKIIDKTVSKPIRTSSDPLRYWGVCIWQWNENGNLRTMNRVFQRLDYKFVNGSNCEDWDVLWSFDFPFLEQWPQIFHPALKSLKQHQRINHFPGINFITSKAYMNLVNQHQPFILKTFRFPQMITEFKDFAATNPTRKFVEKHQHNRGVKIVKVTDVDYSSTDKIYQEFMDKPFLIDGRVFDLGIFVLITSIDPLRVYRFNSEVLLRFCPEPYYPFDEKNIDKYVIYETHKHFFEMPSLNHYFDNYGFSFKNAFEDHLKSRGHDVETLNEKIDDAIVQIIRGGEMNMLNETIKRYRSSRNFFELVRFDFILDDALNFYLMEVNMSPNLTPMSGIHERNAISNEHLVYEALNLIGAGSKLELMSCYDSQSDEMLSNLKNIAVGAANCVKNSCNHNCNRSECQLCATCLNDDNLRSLHQAHREHTRRGGFKRIFPSEINFDEDLFSKMSPNNQLAVKWFKEKCRESRDWC